MSRIKIQYSIELDELEPEVKRLFNKIIEAHSHLSNFNIDREMLTVGVLEEIDAARQELAKLDALYTDIGAITQSYLTYKAQEAAYHQAQRMHNESAFEE